MARNYSNIALDTTLTAGIAAGDLSCVVSSASGWPAAPFAAVLDPGLVTEEVVQVAVKVGTTFTITRGFDGTTAAAHALGAVVRHSAIAGDFTDLQAADTIEASARAADDLTLAGLIATEASARAAADLFLTPMARTLTINGVVFDLSANRSWTVSGGVSNVTASAPLASSGGATPDISFTGTLATTLGGTGVNNAGTLTNASNTAITGGGTLALGGFTLTIPATGSAALLATSNLFSVRQDIRASGAALAAGLHVPWVSGDTLTTLLAGSNNAGNTQIAVNALGYSNFALRAYSANGACFQAIANVPSDLSIMNNTLYTGSGASSDYQGIVMRRLVVSGTPGVGFGLNVSFNLASSTGAESAAGKFSVVWGDATHATRTSAATLSTISNAGALTERARFDAGAGAGTTGFFLWDVDNNTLERVTVGIADSGGIGFKLLRIPN